MILFFAIGTFVLLTVAGATTRWAYAQETIPKRSTAEDEKCTEEYLRSIGAVVVNCSGDNALQCPGIGGSPAGTVGPIPPSSASTLEERTKVAMQYLIGKGLTINQAAGIVGNLTGESSVDPKRKQGAGYQTISSFSEVVPDLGFGIAQWTSGGRQQNWGNFAQTHNADPLDLNLQLAFLWEEMTVLSPKSYGYTEITQAADVRQATWIFLVFFERPASTSGYEEDPVQATTGDAKAALDARTALAESALQIYNGGGPIPSSVCKRTAGGPVNAKNIAEYAKQYPEFQGGPMEEVTGIVLHWTGGNSPSGEAFVDMIAGRPESGCCSVQFWVNKNGEVYQLVDAINTKTSHASQWNGNTIGIEIEAGSDGTVATAEREINSQTEQKTAVINLVISLAKQFNIDLKAAPQFSTNCSNPMEVTPRGLLGHFNYPCGEKSDPGSTYLETIRSEVRKAP